MFVWTTPSWYRLMDHSMGRRCATGENNIVASVSRLVLGTTWPPDQWLLVLSSQELSDQCSHQLHLVPKVKKIQNSTSNLLHLLGMLLNFSPKCIITNDSILT